MTHEELNQRKLALLKSVWREKRFEVHSFAITRRQSFVEALKPEVVAAAMQPTTADMRYVTLQLIGSCVLFSILERFVTAARSYGVEPVLAATSFAQGLSEEQAVIHRNGHDAVKAISEALRTGMMVLHNAALITAVASNKHSHTRATRYECCAEHRGAMCVFLFKEVRLRHEQAVAREAQELAAAAAAAVPSPMADLDAADEVADVIAAMPIDAPSQ